jgi:hypothetical protein
MAISVFPIRLAKPSAAFNHGPAASRSGGFPAADFHRHGGSEAAASLRTLAEVA